MCLHVESTKLKYPKLSKIPGLKWLKKYKNLKSEFKIAEKNILVYKEVIFINDICSKSFYSDYKYFLNDVNPKIKICFEIDGFDNNVIRKGYHSRINDKLMINNSLFIIPKGAKYITGSENGVRYFAGVVSEQIIYKGFYNNKEEHDNLLERLIQEYGDTLEIQNEL